MGYIEQLRALIGHHPVIFNVSGAIILDEQSRVLLQKRVFPENTWGIPGGFMEIGETTRETARREVFEETGLTIDRLELFDVYAGSDLYEAENGDQYYTVTTLYATRHYSGSIKIDSNESIAFEFHPFYAIPEKIFPEHRRILNDFFNRNFLQ